MDANSIAWVFISILGIIEVGGLIWTARKYRTTIHDIPVMCKEAAKEMLKDPEFRKEMTSIVCDQEFLEALGKGIMLNIKAQVFGALGGDAKARKHFEGEVTSAVLAEQGIDLSALAELIPEGSKLRPVFEKMQKNPELLPQFFQIAQKLYTTFKQYQVNNGVLTP